MMKHFLVLTLVLQALWANAVPRSLSPGTSTHAIHFSRPEPASGRSVFRHFIHRAGTGNNENNSDRLLILALSMGISGFTFIGIAFFAALLAPFSWVTTLLLVLGIATGLIAIISSLALFSSEKTDSLQVIGGILGITGGIFGFWGGIRIWRQRS